MAARMFEKQQIKLAIDLTADGTSEVKTTVVDMANWDEAQLHIWHGDVDTAAVMVYTMKENTANSTTSPTPSTVSLTDASGTGASISSGTGTITESSGNLDDKCIVINVPKAKLSKQYLFCSITCSVESHEIDKAEWVLTRNVAEPVSQSSDVAAVFYAA